MPTTPQLAVTIFILCIYIKKRGAYNPQNEMLAFCKTKCSIRKTKRIFSIIPS